MNEQMRDSRNEQRPPKVQCGGEDKEKEFRGTSWGIETQMEWAMGAEGRTKALRTLATGVSFLFPIF